MSQFVAAVILLVLGAAQGSLFGPFGPFGPFGQQPAQPGFPAFPSFGPPPGVAQFLPPGVGFPPALGPQFPPALGPQFPPAFFPVRFTAAPESSVGKFRAKPSGVLERLAVANLPADLQQRLDELLVAFEQGNTACDQAYPLGGPFTGLHRKCVVAQKLETEKAANALEQEAKDRATAESATANVVDVTV